MAHIVISMLPTCILGPCSILKLIIPQALSFLAFQWLIALAYSFLAAALALGFGISDFSSFPEVNHQRPLDFRALMASILHDS